MKSPDELRRHNTLKILKYIYEKGQSTKQESALSTGLTLVTASSIFNRLHESSTIIQTGIEKGSIGRNSAVYSYNPELYILGITVYMDSIAFRIENLNKNMVDRKVFLIKPDDDYEKIMGIIKKFLNQSQYNLIYIGISIPGVYDYFESKVTFSPNIICLRNRDLKSDVEKIRGIKTIIEKDVYGGALVLKENYSDFSLLISIRGGIGCGFLYGGNIMKGSSSMAGEIGHISIDPKGPQCRCGNRGCIETYCSDLAILSNLGMYRIEDAIKSANEGDNKAISEMKKACDQLSKTISDIVKYYNPENVIINCRFMDEVAEIKKYLMSIINEKVKIRVIHEETIYEEGAIHIVKEKLFNDIENNILIGGNN